MRRAHLSSIVTATALVCVARPERANARDLLSIRGIAVPANGIISGFHVETFGVRVFAVCRLLPGWTISAGSALDLFGTLDGTSAGGAANLGRADADGLRDLYLVEILGYQAQERRDQVNIHPASGCSALCVAYEWTMPIMLQAC
jgi:hypothetical protein